MQTTASHTANPFSPGSSTQPAIIFPAPFTPGTTDNYFSNEVFAAGISATQIWAQLADISKWTTYYKNCAQVTPPAEGPQLLKGRVFKFSTFGFAPLTCEVRESVAPERGREGRLAWYSRVEEGVEVYHAWLVQDVGAGRVRVLTQESQIGEVFKGWSVQKPNLMLLGHQDWLDGLVSKARGEKIGETNLEAVGFSVGQLVEDEEVEKPAVKFGV